METFVHLHRSQIDANFWDTLVGSSPQRIIYAFSWYLDVISPEWEAIVLLAENGEYKAVMPLPIRKRYGLKRVQQPYHCQQLGIFCRFDEVTPKLMNQFIAELKRTHTWVINYCFNEANPIVLLEETQIVRNDLLNLNRNYQVIKQGYATERRANLRKAGNFEFKIDPDFAKLVALHRQNHEQKYLKKGEKIDIKWLLRLQNLYQVLARKGLAKLTLAYQFGEVQAGILLIYDTQRIIYFYNAATEKGRKQHARLQILDEVFQRHAEKVAWFDFESPIDALNVQTYYRSFGTKSAPYLRISYNYLPKWLKILQNLRKKLFTV